MFMRSKLILLHVCSWFDVAIRKFIIKNSSSKCWLRFHLPLWRNNFPLKFCSSFNFRSFPWLGTSTFKKKSSETSSISKKIFSIVESLHEKRRGTKNKKLQAYKCIYLLLEGLLRFLDSALSQLIQLNLRLKQADPLIHNLYNWNKQIH